MPGEDGPRETRPGRPRPAPPRGRPRHRADSAAGAWSSFG